MVSRNLYYRGLDCRLKQAEIENQEAQTAFYRKQTELLNKKKKRLSLDNVAKVVAIVAIIAIPTFQYMVGISVLEKSSQNSLIRADNNRLASKVEQLTKENSSLIAENALFKGQSRLFQGTVLTSLQGGTLSSTVVLGAGQQFQGFSAIQSSTQFNQSLQNFANQSGITPLQVDGTPLSFKNVLTTGQINSNFRQQ